MKPSRIRIDLSDVAGTLSPPCELSLRFSCFPKVDEQGDFTNVKYLERVYENGTKVTAPELRELKWSQEAYKFFTKSNSVSMTPGDTSFWSLLRKSNPGTIYFIDPHFGKRNLARLYALAKDIEQSSERAQKDFIVITNSDNEDVGMQELIKERFTETRAWKYASLRVYILKENNNKDLLHDRFVLTGGYFWHFGSSAGGMHDCLTAFSGPWQDVENSLLRLVEAFTQHSPIPKSFCSKEI